MTKDQRGKGSGSKLTNPQFKRTTSRNSRRRGCVLFGFFYVIRWIDSRSFYGYIKVYTYGERRHFGVRARRQRIKCVMDILFESRSRETVLKMRAWANTMCVCMCCVCMCAKGHLCAIPKITGSARTSNSGWMRMCVLAAAFL